MKNYKVKGRFKYMEYYNIIAIDMTKMFSHSRRNLSLLDVTK